MSLALEAGDVVKLAGFGNFALREKPQRPGRNPKTGEDVLIKARRIVTFHASAKLKVVVEHSMRASLRSKKSSRIAAAFSAALAATSRTPRNAPCAPSSRSTSS